MSELLPGAPVPVLDLVDDHARPVTLETFRGRPALVFFGFTHCRMVCPRALGRLSEVLDRLGPLGDRLTALYVTVDPERDTPEVMRTFLAATAPRFTGLTGSVEQVERAKRSFGVFTRRAPDPQDPEGYAVPHTAITYVLDPAGRYLAHLGDGLDAEQMTERLRSVLTTVDAGRP